MFRGVICCSTIFLKEKFELWYNLLIRIRHTALCDLRLCKYYVILIYSFTCLKDYLGCLCNTYYSAIFSLPGSGVKVQNTSIEQFFIGINISTCLVSPVFLTDHFL